MSRVPNEQVIAPDDVDEIEGALSFGKAVVFLKYVLGASSLVATSVVAPPETVALDPSVHATQVEAVGELGSPLFFEGTPAAAGDVVRFAVARSLAHPVG